MGERFGDAVAELYGQLAAEGIGGQAATVLRTLPDGGAGASIVLPGAVTNPNDLVVAPSGVVFLTDPQYQLDGVTRGVYRVAVGGAVDAVKEYPGEAPDGIALSPDGAILYVAVGRAAKRIERFLADLDAAVKGEPVAE